MKNDNADLFIIYILSLFIYLNFLCAFVFVFTLRFGNLNA
ncbi:putative membrane protein [Escherichia coli EPECa14]|nr:putative membrane protein [Escherichia coli EPECa14]